jgi:hypothetical protein
VIERLRECPRCVAVLALLLLGWGALMAFIVGRLRRRR